MIADKQFTTIYIDALALVPAKKSGVGMSTHNTLMQLIEQLDDDMQICLVVPLGKAKYLQCYTGPKVFIKTYPLPARVMEVLLRIRLLPPVDWLMGQGIYVFPNYRNWPLWSSRSLTYVYDLSFILHPQVVSPKNQRYLSRYIRLWTSRADKLITISEQVRDELEKYLNVFTPKIQIIYCGVDMSLFYKRSADEVLQARNRYDIPFDKYLLFVGNIEPRKNLLTLLNAYEQLPAKVRDAHGLVIVGGDGWLNESINQRIEELQSASRKVLRVQKYVTNEDLPALYSGASLVVHPALYEGFGMTPLEAMACEVPVIVADTPALREVGGDAAVYVPSSDVLGFTSAITACLDKPDAAHITKGLARAHAFSWSNAAAALSETINECQRLGPRRLVLLRFAKDVYKSCDIRLRSLLGEKALPEYRPHPRRQADLYQTIVTDFINEQPNALQTTGLKLYLRSKSLVAHPLKKVIRLIRR